MTSPPRPSRVPSLIATSISTAFTLATPATLAALTRSLATVRVEGVQFAVRIEGVELLDRAVRVQRVKRVAY